MSEKPTKIIDKPVRTIDLTSLSVEDAVNALVPHLPMPIQEFLMEMEIQEGHSPVDYILGYINRHYETGELSYRQSEGMAASMRPTPTEPVIKGPTVAKCKQCGNEFTLSHLGQLFCPDLDNGQESCGSKWNRAERIRAAEARGDFRYSRPSPEHVKTAELLVAQGWRKS